MLLIIFSLCFFTHSNLLSHFVNNIIPQHCKHFNRSPLCGKSRGGGVRPVFRLWRKVCGLPSAHKWPLLCAASSHQRTCFARASFESGSHPAKQAKPLAPKTGRGGGVGWDGWIRTSENARVKVWCLTAWRHPNMGQGGSPLHPNIITRRLWDVKSKFTMDGKNFRQFSGSGACK